MGSVEPEFHGLLCCMRLFNVLVRLWAVGYLLCHVITLFTTWNFECFLAPTGFFFKSANVYRKSSFLLLQVTCQTEIESLVTDNQLTRFTLTKVKNCVHTGHWWMLFSNDDITFMLENTAIILYVLCIIAVSCIFSHLNFDNKTEGFNTVKLSVLCDIANNLLNPSDFVCFFMCELLAMQNLP